MEPNLTGNLSETIKPRTGSGIDTPIRSHPKGAEGLPQDPVYPGQSTKAVALGETYEGFSNSRDSGIKNLEKAEGFGSKFQMPGPDMSEKYASAKTGSTREDGSRSQSAQKSAETGTEPVMDQFVDIHQSIQAIQILIQKLRDNLASPEQAELEHLMLQGAQLLSSNWKQLTSTTTEQISSIKGELKDNPYRGLIGALKVGMALSQVWAAAKSQTGLPQGLNQEIEDSKETAAGHPIH